MNRSVELNVLESVYIIIPGNVYQAVLILFIEVKLVSSVCVQTLVFNNQNTNQSGEINFLCWLKNCS